MADERNRSCPMNRSQVIERYFMEHRAKLLDIAAFLDRLDRAKAADGREDFRVAAFREATKVLGESQSHRAKRVLELFSDPTMEPIESAAGMKGAFGAWPGASNGS